MRLIDADELKRRLNGWYDPYHKGGDEIEIDTLLDMIDEESTVFGWISVKDRLPKDSGIYLVGWADFNSEIAHFIPDCHDMKFGLNDPVREHRPSWFYYDSEWGEVEHQDVEYWMVIPDVPTETEGEE